MRRILPAFSWGLGGQSRKSKRPGLLRAVSVRQPIVLFCEKFLALFALALERLEPFRRRAAARVDLAIRADVFRLQLDALVRTLAAPAGRKWAWGLISGLVVLSHWPIDWLVHRPDLPLAPGTEPLGLGLWYRPWIAWPLEIGLLAAATWWFARAVPSRARAAWGLSAFMLLVQVVSRTAFPPAESITALAPTALFAYALFPALAAWALRKPINPRSNV